MLQLENISVRYRLVKERPKTFQEHVINFLKGKRLGAEAFYALTGVSLMIEKGESLSIIGHNGAGKSTLLKVISGVIKPTEGRVLVEGNIAPLIELHAGFDGDLTGRENVYLNASILGFQRREIDERIEDIIEFSELRDFINSPLKNYSSGMVARLGFSIATEVDPDVLIIDEVLAVGDEHFRVKSKKRIQEFRRRGTTILFVSHEMEEVREVSDRVVWLHHGRVRMSGKPADVIAEYLRQRE